MCRSDTFALDIPVLVGGSDVMSKDVGVCSQVYRPTWCQCIWANSLPKTWGEPLASCHSSSSPLASWLLRCWASGASWATAQVLTVEIFAIFCSICYIYLKKKSCLMCLLLWLSRLDPHAGFDGHPGSDKAPAAALLPREPQVPAHPEGRWDELKER